MVPNNKKADKKSLQKKCRGRKTS